jgi:hypothetical protein
MRKKKNKKLIFLFIIAIIVNSNCITYSTAYTNAWFGYDVLPSKINYYDIVFQSKFDDGTNFYVVFDFEIQKDANYYISKFMQDFGWYLRNDGKWYESTHGAKQQKMYTLYVNPNKKVAVYFYEKGKYDVFKVYIDIIEKDNGG